MQNYKEKNHIATAVIKKAKKQSWEIYVKTLTRDTPSKEVWAKINSIKKTYKPTNYPIKLNGKYTDNNELKANAIAQNLKSICTLQVTHCIQQELLIEEKIEVNDNEELNREFSLDELLRAIKTLKNKTPGLDQIHNMFIKKAPLQLLKDILNLYNQSLKTMDIPNKWKIATIIPILKPGKDGTIITSYRPIALLSCIGKLMEHLVHNRINYFVQSNNLLQDSQYGFRKGLSTMDVLLRIEHTIRQAQMMGEVCLVVYIDLSNAFDTVNPLILLSKLARYNLTGNMLGWLKKYLINRSITVKLGSTYSKILRINAGVPQGGILSPLLFNLMLSDMPKDTYVDVLSYADDITLVCKNKDYLTAESQMQSCINRLSEWFENQELKVNPGKTYLQYFSRKRLNINLKINGMAITMEKEHRLLGMTIDMPHLNWRKHVNNIIFEGYRRINIMKTLSSTTWGASPKILRNLYISFIRSKLEYGSMLYADVSLDLRNKLNILQNACLCIILGACKTTPILSLEIEANIFPLNIRFSYLQAKKYIQFCYRPKDDTTASKLKVTSSGCISGISNTFKHRATFSLISFGRDHWDRSNRSEWLFPPWNNISTYVETEMSNEDVSNIVQFNTLVENKYSDFLQIYTDGSKLDNGSTSSAVYIAHNKKTYSWKLGFQHSILAAELHAIKMSLFIIKLNSHFNKTKIVVFSDSKSALTMIQATNNRSDQNVNDIISLLYELNQSKHTILQWIKGHSGIEGNEIADKAAKSAHEKSYSVLHPLSYKDDIALLNKEVQIYWKNYWLNQTQVEQKGLFLVNIKKHMYPRKWYFSRRIECLLTHLRTGHIQLNSYLFRFNLSDTDLCSFCNVIEDIEHYLLRCYKYSASRMLLEHDVYRAGGEMSLSCLLGGDSVGKKQLKILKATVNYIKNTSIYKSNFIR